MLRKITFLWRRKDLMIAIFKYLKSHHVEENTNLIFVSPEKELEAAGRSYTDMDSSLI